MKQYTIGVTVSCKKLMKVMAHNKNDAVTKAEIVFPFFEREREGFS